MQHRGQRLAAVLAVVSGFFGVLPTLLYGIFNTGVLALTGLAVLSAVYAAARPGWPPIWRRVLGWVLALALTGSVLLSLPMLWRGYLCAPQPGTVQVVLVLGGKINGDRPSLILAYRLRRAAAALEASPDAVCVVTGGQGADEAYPEAAVMRNYLLELGVQDARIFTEQRSRNTRENMQFSAEMMRQHGLQGRVTIVTDAFHQLRASLYAAEAGLQSDSLSSKTPWGLVPTYWVREFFALGKYALERAID